MHFLQGARFPQRLPVFPVHGVVRKGKTERDEQDGQDRRDDADDQHPFSPSLLHSLP